jgi:hypothetical protein
VQIFCRLCFGTPDFLTANRQLTDADSAILLVASEKCSRLGFGGFESSSMLLSWQ